jgi:hypothetical protein
MKKQLLPLALILLLTGLLTPVLQDYVRQVIVRPFLYFFWVGWLFINSIPQIGIWGLFLFIALLIMGRSLLKQRPTPPRLRRPQKTDQGRIETWAKLIHRANQEPYYKWKLAQHLQEFTLDALAHDERQAPKQIRQRLLNNNLDIPPEIQAYLQAGMTSFSRLLGPRPLFRPRTFSSSLNLNPEQIAHFLEDKFDYRTD